MFDFKVGRMVSSGCRNYHINFESSSQESTNLRKQLRRFSSNLAKYFRTCRRSQEGYYAGFVSLSVQQFFSLGRSLSLECYAILE
jgi:hypothetical protein